MQARAQNAQWWGLLVVVALAVGRETRRDGRVPLRRGLQQFSHRPVPVDPRARARRRVRDVLGSSSAAAARCPWRTFFRISEILLLLLAGGLLVTGLEKLIALGVLPPLADQLWDTTALLDDSTRLGGFIAAMTGYRAQPALAARARARRVLGHDAARAAVRREECRKAA